MSGRGRRPRHPRQRTSPTVVRTHLAVITGVSNGGDTVSVHHEIELVKASLLYADTIEVLSLGNQIVREVNKFAAGDANNMWALLGALDDETLRHLGPNLDVDTFRQVLPLLAADPAALRAFASLDPEMAQLSELADILDQSKEMANSSMVEMRQVTEQMRVDSGVAELETVLDQKLVRFNENVTIGEDTDAVIASFIDELKRYLQDPTRFVLLDATMASLARSLIDEGHVRLPERAVSNASEAVLGTGILARLPAFTTAPLDEVVDLRRDLDEPLGRYRRKVSRLRSELRTGPFDQHIEAEVDALWRNEVDPAIVEIRQAMADHGLVREILRSLSGNVSDFVKGVGLPAGVTVSPPTCLTSAQLLLPVLPAPRPLLLPSPRPCATVRREGLRREPTTSTTSTKSTANSNLEAGPLAKRMTPRLRVLWSRLTYGSVFGQGLLRTRSAGSGWSRFGRYAAATGGEVHFAELYHPR